MVICEKKFMYSTMLLKIGKNYICLQLFQSFKNSAFHLFNDQKSRESRLGDYLHKMCCLAYWHNESKIFVKSYYILCKYRYLNLRITKNMKTKIHPIWASSHLNRSISCKKNYRQKGLEFGIYKFALLRLKSLYLNSCTTSRGFFHKTLKNVGRLHTTSE